jgi:hypothetical protein
MKTPRILNIAVYASHVLVLVVVFVFLTAFTHNGLFVDLGGRLHLRLSQNDCAVYKGLEDEWHCSYTSYPRFPGMRTKWPGFGYAYLWTGAAYWTVRFSWVYPIAVAGVMQAVCLSLLFRRMARGRAGTPCPRCGKTGRHLFSRKLTADAWIYFVIFLFLWPFLCWIPFVADGYGFRGRERRCRACGFTFVPDARLVNFG